ncbi:probable nicotinamide mononucleotide adenylyltransferase [Phialocephala subalpina]|uniref:Nicotinamide-nucleotide adenylyltransferase n=1 Tax=Phialocephala subalpina TaxID=576137 RepID=A0A1L7X4C3_9HELO|nr:probable nicotinamide mononucleotide adenylyltransferase [Phialocephala subalpina]
MASGISAQTPNPPTSQNAFPSHRLTLRQRYPEKQPLCLVACGSFSPITYLHLRMFEMASDYAKFNTDFEIMGGLAPAIHRLRMCELAVEPADWLMVDHWEAKNSSYIPTALVLDHFNHEINEVLGGAEKPDGTRVPMRIVLLAGADLIQTMSTPGVWSSEDLKHILRVYGAFIVERQGTDIDDALSSLEAFRNNIYVIKQIIQNDVSSTKIRLFLRRELSIRYLVPSAVVEYIEENDLYKEEGTTSIEDKGKEKADG